MAKLENLKEGLKKVGKFFPNTKKQWIGYASSLGVTAVTSSVTTYVVTKKKVANKKAN